MLMILADFLGHKQADFSWFLSWKNKLILADFIWKNKLILGDILAHNQADFSWFLSLKNKLILADFLA